MEFKNVVLGFLGFPDDVDQEIMAQVLAESQKTYFEELKSKKGKKRRASSPGPSTSLKHWD